MLDRDKYLSEAEAKKLMEFCESQSLLDLERGRTYWPRRWAIVDVLLNTGMRASECRLLKIQDLSLTAKEPCISVVNGKGGRQRTVPISGKLRKHLKSYLKQKELLGESTKPEDHLFVNRLKKPYSLIGIQALFKKCARDAGLRPCYSIHSTRHAYGFATFQRSKNIRLTQVLLGHRRLATTEVYTHVDPQQVIETVENLW